MEKSEKELTGGHYGDGHVLEDDHSGKEEDARVIYCGAGSCRPGFMQKCVNIKCLTAALSFAGLTISTLDIYINSQITTLERQFGFSSRISGILLSCNDVGFLLTTLFMSFLARRVHIPRVLGLSTLLFGISGLVCSIPFFATRGDLPPVEELSTSRLNASSLSANPGSIFGRSLCVPTSPGFNSSPMLGGFMGSNSSGWLGREDGGGDSCDDEESNKHQSSAIAEDGRWMAITCLGLGMVLQGFGKSPRHPFIGTYIDDNVPKTKTTMYLGFLTSVSMLGFLLAFVLGGVFTRMYVTLEDVNMTPMDPRWVGAWWLGFLLFGFMGVLAAIPPCFFPRRLRPQPHLRKIEQDRKLKNKGRGMFLVDAKEFLKSSLRLLTTPVYLCVVMMKCMSLFGVAGTMSFLPKYLETQFMIPAWEANIIMGGINIIAASLGTMVGGFVTSRYKLSPLKCLKLMVIISLFCILTIMLGFFLGCDQPHLSKGASTEVSASRNFTEGSCLANCHCDNTRFFPICGSDGVTYLSPCHAGCTNKQGMRYTSCSCVNETLMSMAVNSSRGSNLVSADAKPGFCSSDCSMLYPFALSNLLGAFFTTFNWMPTFEVTVRSVSEKDKPLAIGFLAFLTTLLGWFLGPLVYGYVIDTCCILWSSGCDGRGSCSLYNIETFRFRYHSVAIGMRVGCTALLFLALLITVKRRIKFSAQEDVPAAIGNEEKQKPESENLMMNKVWTENGENPEDGILFSGGQKIYKK